MFEEFVNEPGKLVPAQVGQLVYSGVEINLAQDTAGGCGGMTWKAATVLIEYFNWKKSTCPEFLSEKVVVEIGSGTGLVGLVIAKMFPRVKKVVLTDQISMMELMLKNIELNSLSKLVTASILNWGETIPEHSELLQADVIVASDCVYLEISFIPLIETLLALSLKDPLIYLGYSKRRKADKRFFQLARKKFTIVDIDDPKRAIYNRESIRLFALKIKKSS